MEYIVKRMRSGEVAEVSKRTTRENALTVAEQLFFNSDYCYVAVESIDGVIVAEWEI